jgi:hypothetical protein
VTEIPVVVHELMRVATGNRITVRTLTGEDVTLRLATPDEVLRFQREAREHVAALIGEPVAAPPMTRQQAQELCAPLDLASLR